MVIGRVVRGPRSGPRAGRRRTPAGRRPAAPRRARRARAAHGLRLGGRVGHGARGWSDRVRRPGWARSWQAPRAGASGAEHLDGVGDGGRGAGIEALVRLAAGNADQVGVHASS
ncbi:hypothetical protein Aave_1604 [Paracidovorax citrulli AAC00-1]|uniref:Uncharacterized protein n=1 Tax=Paracidovorax citrulli (strain AAC00-1) TaxID=397945 RepID=A1TMK3_PARC0|nr:hypothetical protein Aave_1604 [Paracidovorax citrulli AAC00-1]